MIGKEKLLKKLESVLAQSRADLTDIVYIGNESGLTRFANSYIHQNVFEDNRQVFFRSVIGKRVGVASTNSLQTADLRKSLADSYEIAKQQPENPDFPGLAKPAKYREMDTFDEATATLAPRDRAKIVKGIIAQARKQKFTVAGACSTECGEVAILNSLGVRAYQPVTSASVNMIPMSDTSSGYACSVARRVSEIDHEDMARVAVQKCALSQNPKQVEPGDYEVILEPSAVAELLEWLNYIGFGSKSYQQGTSFLAARSGKKITSEMISIYDDSLNEKSIAFPFDFEGVPKKKVKFIDKGIAGAAVYDMAAAKKAGVKSTGHGGIPGQTHMGAFGLNVFMAPGKAKRDSMIKNVKKGILVTRFHYINGFIDTRNSVLTGMTRDGTFLIEGGEIVCGLKNMRFTDNIMRAFGTAIAVSKETERKPAWWSSVGCTTVPALHLGSFRFSGKTEH